jgi:tetratricopeptide (TPR) repeat protein
VSSSEITDPGTPDDETRTRTRTSGGGPSTYLAPSHVGSAPRDLPATVGRYKITGFLGRGGMGVVVAAQDTELKRAVALKLLLPGVWQDAASARLEREAQAMAKLSHPNVVTVFEVARADDRPIIAMELVTGGTLRDWLKQEKRSWRRTLEMVVAAGRGLAAAHEAGLVHRDFKPENVLVGADGRPRVSDFGLVASSVQSADASDDDRGSIIGGTPAYMPPEQWDGRDLDARADQYAFAVTCWEALWGERPFATRDRTSRPDPSREPQRIRSRHGAPRRLEVALRRALSGDPAKRWPTLSDLLDRLERIARDRRAAIAAGVIATVGAVGLIAFQAGGGTPESPCRSAGAPLDGVWTNARQSKLRDTYSNRSEAFAARAWQATEGTLQEWAEEHRALRIETCELGRTGGDGVKRVASARLECLDQRLTVFGALVTALEAPDTTSVVYARSASLGLPRSAGCRSVTPADPGATTGPVPPAEKLAAAHQELARADVLRLLGKPREALALAQPVAKLADELEWKPLIASAYLHVGRSLHSNHDSDGAEKALQRAILFADASRDDDIRFQATIAITENAQQRSSYDESAHAIESARMIAGRLPDDEERDLAIANQTARLAFWRGEFSECVARTNELIERVDRTKGKVRLGAELRLNLSRCLQAMGKTAEYEAPLREALNIIELTVGREHPFASDAIMGLGAIAGEQHRPADALPLLEEALAIRERIFGPENPDVAKLHNNIGNVLEELGRTDEARKRIERAMEIWLKAWGPDSPAVSVAASNLGRMAMERGDLAAAEAYFKQMLEIRRKTRPAGHPALAGGLVRMGELLIVKRDPASIPLLREAVAAYKTNEAPQEKRDEGTFMLGRALFELGTDRAAGRELMASGCAKYDAKNDPFDCRAYLAKLAARPAR